MLDSPKQRGLGPLFVGPRGFSLRLRLRLSLNLFDMNDSLRAVEAPQTAMTEAPHMKLANQEAGFQRGRKTPLEVFCPRCFQRVLVSEYG